MKKMINRVVSKLALAIIIASLALALPLPRLSARSSASAHTADRASDAPYALQGDDAIRNLKERGLYDSLREAVAIAGFKTDDPTFILRDKLIADDGVANDNLGRSVAINRDTALVGAPSDDNGANTNQGSAYVFVRGDATSWSLSQKLTASDGAAYDQFGSSVAIYSDFAIVGAPNDDVGAKLDQGSAYVFARGGGVWREHQKLTASDGAPNDRFGYSVAINGITAIVGAPYDDVLSSSSQGFAFNTEQGSAYIFISYYADWFQEKRLTASDGATNELFGFSVAVYGDTVVVGAPYDDDGSDTDQGSAYVIQRGGGSWTIQSKLTASDGGTGDKFGYSVAIDTSAYTDTLVVGAPYDDNGSNGNQGSAYVFERGGDSWVEKPKLIASNGVAGDYFGLSVAIDKYTNTVAVGAPYYDTDSNPQQGSVFIFARSGGSWIERQLLTAGDGDNGDNLGNSVAISLMPDIKQVAVMAAAPSDDMRGISDPGSAYIFSAEIVGNF